MLDSRYTSIYRASYRPRLRPSYDNCPPDPKWERNDCALDSTSGGEVGASPPRQAGVGQWVRRQGNYGEHLADRKFSAFGGESGANAVETCTIQRLPMASSRHMPICSRKRALKSAKRDHLKSVMDTNMSTNAAVLSDSLVFDTKFGQMDMKTINALEHKYRYTSSAKRANEEYGLPMIRPEPQKYKPLKTLEPKPDMVRLKGQRYEDATAEWQDAVLFDRCQSRYLIDPTRAQMQPERFHFKRRPAKPDLDDEQREAIRDLVRKDSLAKVFVKQLPGYAGYAPLCPPESALEMRVAPKDMLSLVRDCYRYYPESQHDPYENARTGVMSKLVTLTYPYNPFNKIEKEDIMETLGKHKSGR